MENCFLPCKISLPHAFRYKKWCLKIWSSNKTEPKRKEFTLIASDKNLTPMSKAQWELY